MDILWAWHQTVHRKLGWHLASSCLGIAELYRWPPSQGLGGSSSGHCGQSMMPAAALARWYGRRALLLRQDTAKMLVRHGPWLADAFCLQAVTSQRSSTSLALCATTPALVSPTSFSAPASLPAGRVKTSSKSKQTQPSYNELEAARAKMGLLNPG